MRAPLCSLCLLRQEKWINKEKNRRKRLRDGHLVLSTVRFKNLTMKTETAVKELPKPTSAPAQQIKLNEVLQNIRQKIKTVHVVIVIGVFSVLLGYLSVAPPTDLPNWPLYSLNARTWQFFERWVRQRYIVLVVSSYCLCVEYRIGYSIGIDFLMLCRSFS